MTLKTTLQTIFTAPQGRIAAWIIIVLMVLLILKNMGGIVAAFKSPAAVAPPTETFHEKPAPRGEDIAKWHLLGEVPRPGLDAASLPKSLINVTLVGIFSASPAVDAMVAVKLADGREKIYVAGEVLTDGVIIYKILPDRVIVKRGDRYEVLMLPEDKIRFEPSIAPLDFEQFHD